MSASRRDLLVGAAACWAALVAARCASGQTKEPSLGPDRVVLLGTRGGPFIGGYTPSPSANLLVYRSVPYVIDAGYGVSFKLIDAGIPLAALRYVFITHHHSDHNLELGPLLYNSWVDGRKSPVEVFAPAGLDTMLAAYWESNRFDIETRIADEGRPDPRKLVNTHEIHEGVLLNEHDVRVSALRVVHPPVSETYAFKFELGGKKVVFSGDTAYFPPLADFAADADYLIHEVLYVPALDSLMSRRPNAERLKASIMSHHTKAEDVGRIATAAKAKTLVLNHFVPPDDKSMSPDIWANAVRPTFEGKIIVGKDLLRLPL